MKITNNLLVIISVLTFSLGCKKDNPPPAFNAVSAAVTAADVLEVVFDAPIDASSASNTVNYSLERAGSSDPAGTRLHPVSIEAEDTKVLLRFSQRFVTDNYTLRFAQGGLQSAAGGELTTTHLEFSYEAPNTIKEVKNMKIPESVVEAIHSSTGFTDPAIYWYFSLDEGKEVAASEVSTEKWDIAFLPHAQGARWLANAGSYYQEGDNDWVLAPGGDGKAGLVLLAQHFDEIKTVPEGTNFHEQGKEQFTSLDLETIGQFGWFDGMAAVMNNVITPLPNRTILVKTNKGNYAKIQIQSVYKDNPENPTATSEKFYLHFRYFVQTDGSTDLDTSGL